MTLGPRRPGRSAIIGYAAGKIAKWGGKKLKNWIKNKRAKTSKSKSSSKSSSSSSSAEKKLFQNAKNGQGITYTAYKIRGPRTPLGIKMFKIVAKNNFRFTNSGRMSATVGKQQVATVLSLGDTNTFATAATTSGGILTEKFVVDKLTGKIMFTNQDDGNSELVLYDVVCRRDSSTGIAGVYLPNGAMDSGIVETSSGSTSTKDSTNYGATPFMSPEFCQHFKILKVSRIMLSSGQSHEHTVSYGINKIVNGEYLADYLQYKGMTFYTLAISKGMPYNDTTTKTQVSTGVTQVDWVATQNVQYQNLSANATSYQYTNADVTSFTVGEQVMNSKTGASVAEAAA